MKKILVTVCLLIFIIGCKNKRVDANQGSNTETISILDTLSLKLNANKKWIANTETHEGVIKMDSIISTFKTNNKSNYKALGNNLSKQTSYIIKHCSMKGKPHDQLHVVLIPMLDEISILKDENNEELVKFAFNNLEQLISAYFKFFKV